MLQLVLPVRFDFEAVLRMMRNTCGHFCLFMWDNVGRKDELFLEDPLGRHLVGLYENVRRPGYRGSGGELSVAGVYRFDDEAIEDILYVSHIPYTFNMPCYPEDLALFDADGAYRFVTVAHEKVCVLRVPDARGDRIDDLLADLGVGRAEVAVEPDEPAMYPPFPVAKLPTPSRARPGKARAPRR